MNSSNESEPLLPPLTGNFVNDCFSLATIMQGSASALQCLARAFVIVGNDKLSDQLFEEASLIRASSDRIREICGARTSDDLKHIQEASGNILMSCLAGIHAKDGFDPAGP